MKKRSHLLLILFLSLTFLNAQTTGDIIITEIMPNPDALSDTDGEYIELYNTTSSSIDIQNFVLSEDGGGNTHTIGSSVNIPAKGFVILGRSANPLGSNDIRADYNYSSVTLNNSGDNIKLENSSGTTICSVDYSSSSAGESKELDDVSKVSNGVTSSFTPATLTMINGDKGSPKAKGNTIGIAGLDITNVSNDPSQPTSSQKTTILADVDNGTVSSVEVHWGTSPDNLSDTINMSVTSSPKYDSDSDIPAQSSSTTVYYKVFATDNNSNERESILHDYTSYDPPDLVINEILADPDGDANGDGTVDSNDDEFIELVNRTGSNLDVSGWEIHDTTGLRDTVSSSTILANDEALVIFGGGSPSNIPGEVQKTDDLGLNNTGDKVKIYNDNGLLVTSYDYGSEAEDNQSLARTPDFTGNFVKHTNISSNSVEFSPGRKNSDDSALPVGLISFHGNAEQDHNIIRWSTASEQNNDFFTLERSLDRKEFDVLTTVDGVGNSNEVLKYEARDHDVGKEVIYYRLKQTDYDGQYSYSDIISVKRDEDYDAEMTVDYRYGQNNLKLNLQYLEQGSLVIEMYDMMGRQIKQEKYQIRDRYKSVDWNISEFDSGIYILKVTNNQKTLEHKLMLD